MHESRKIGFELHAVGNLRSHAFNSFQSSNLDRTIKILTIGFLSIFNGKNRNSSIKIERSRFVEYLTVLDPTKLELSMN